MGRYVKNLMANGPDCLLVGNENVQDLDSGDDCTTLWVQLCH